MKLPKYSICGGLRGSEAAAKKFGFAQKSLDGGGCPSNDFEI